MGHQAMDSANPRSHKRGMAAARHRSSSLRRLVLESSGNKVVAARMLVFQTNLLLMNTASRRLRRTGARGDLKRVERLRAELHRAEAALQMVELEQRLGSGRDYWLAVYASLIDRASESLHRLTSELQARPAEERFEAATDVQMLEELIFQWTSRMETIRHGIPGGTTEMPGE